VFTICIFNFSEKEHKIFEIGLKKHGVILEKIAIGEKNIWEKIRRHGLDF